MEFSYLDTTSELSPEAQAALFQQRTSLQGRHGEPEKPGAGNDKECVLMLWQYVI